jgi:protein TonB
MFDLITGKVQHVPNTPAISILVSTGIQAAALGAIVVTSLLYATKQLPAVPDVLAFVAEMPTAAPPPPPAPPAQVKPRVVTPQAAASSAQSAPVEAPARIEAEPTVTPSADPGVPGGVEGGIAAGVVGGVPPTVMAGLDAPPPPVSNEPIRLGGQLKPPALIKRVEPIYPQIAQLAGIDGIVILDAIIDEHGHVQSVKVLRGHALLAAAATDAVQQWIYEPLRLNGTPTAFELTVTLSFHFDEKRKLRV